MPILTRWFLRASLLFFMLAMVIGVLVAARTPLNIPGSINALDAVYFHVFMVGWVAQLIFGVVFWMFPKLSKDKPRGSEILGWFASFHANWLWLSLLGRTAEAAGVLGFVAHVWPRIKGY